MNKSYKLFPKGRDSMNNNINDDIQCLVKSIQIKMRDGCAFNKCEPESTRLINRLKPLEKHLISKYIYERKDHILKHVHENEDLGAEFLAEKLHRVLDLYNEDKYTFATYFGRAFVNFCIDRKEKYLNEKKHTHQKHEGLSTEILDRLPSDEPNIGDIIMEKKMKSNPDAFRKLFNWLHSESKNSQRIIVYHSKKILDELLCILDYKEKAVKWKGVTYLLITDDMENAYSCFFGMKFYPEFLVSLKERFIAKGESDAIWMIPSRQDEADWMRQLTLNYEKAPKKFKDALQIFYNELFGQ
jgi:hypothetical protein